MAREPEYDDARPAGAQPPRIRPSRRGMAVIVRIGVLHTPKEIEIELADDADGDKLAAEVEAAISGDDKVLWLTDRRGRRAGTPAERRAYRAIGRAHERAHTRFG